MIGGGGVVVCFAVVFHSRALSRVAFKRSLDRVDPLHEAGQSRKLGGWWWWLGMRLNQPPTHRCQRGAAAIALRPASMALLYLNLSFDVLLGRDDACSSSQKPHPWVLTFWPPLKSRSDDVCTLSRVAVALKMK